MSSDSIPIKLPIKNLEIPIRNLNEIATPHYLGLLRGHKRNIKKFRSTKNWDELQNEQRNASRVVKHMEQLLHDMDNLRCSLEDFDIEKFDKQTSKSRSNIIDAIKEYLAIKFEPSLPTVQQETSYEETNDSNERFLQLQDQQEEVNRQEACLYAWNILQNDLQQLHQLFVDFNKMIHDQQEHVNIIEQTVEEVEINVEEGNKNLVQASKFKVAAYPFAGAVVGTCIGGPIGMVAGMKLGGLAAVCCGFLGFTGAKIIKKKQLESLENHETEEDYDINKDTIDAESKNSQGSLKNFKKTL